MPAVINSKALNRAWVIKWKKVICGTFIASLNIIVPSWLNVDRAIIFFISHSLNALRPAIKEVKQAEKRSKNSSDSWCLRVSKNRTKIKTPAVTRVEECTRADTGVGAAMAAGSHLINGYWALFVIAATIIINATIEWLGEDHGIRGSQCVLIDHEIVNKIKISPSRFVIAVISAALCDLGVW